MKKIMLTTMLLIGFLNPFNAKSQTKEQTVNWLKSKLGALHGQYANSYKIEAGSTDAYLIYSQYAGYRDYRRVEFSKVTGVSYTRVRDEQRGEGFMITLGGSFDKVEKWNAESKEWRESYVEEQYQNHQNLKFTPDMFSKMDISYFGISEDEIKRVVKAYSHLATLCGGKVVSDDLFKN